jgi:type VI secretion system secreted protein VgrG
MSTTKEVVGYNPKNNPKPVVTATSTTSPTDNTQGKNVSVRVFGVKDIPDVMHNKLKWPKSAKVMEKWFSLPAWRMSDKDKTGNTPARDVQKEHAANVIIDMFTMKWILGFARARKAKKDLLNEKIKNPKAMEELEKCLEKNGAYAKLKNPGDKYVIDNRAMNVVDLHNDWQFQIIPITNFENDDLYGSLGKFALYAAISKATIIRQVSYGIFDSVKVRLNEVAIYMRDTFDFNGEQYLGHWNFEGMDTDYQTALMDFSMQKFESQKTKHESDKDMHWRSGEPYENSELGWVFPINNADFAVYRRTNKMGGDLLLFSDIIFESVDLDWTHSTELRMPTLK